MSVAPAPPSQTPGTEAQGKQPKNPPVNPEYSPGQHSSAYPQQQGYQQPGYPTPQGYPPTYYPQQPGYPPPPGIGPYGVQEQYNNPTVVVSQPVFTTQLGRYNGLSFSPARTTCQHCQTSVLTKIEYKIGMMSWMICGILALIGLFCPCILLGCCFIPLCVSSTKDVVHRCPNCSQEIAIVPRMS